MEQSAKVGGGGATPSGSREGSPKPPKAEGSMVTSTGEKKPVSPAGSLSSLGGAVGGVGTEAELADLSLDERHSSPSSESSPFKRGGIFRDTTGKTRTGNPLTKRKDRKSTGPEVPYVDMGPMLTFGEGIPSWPVWASLKKLAEDCIPSPKDPTMGILQCLLISLMQGMSVLFIPMEELVQNHKRLVEGTPGPLRTLNTGFSGLDGDAKKIDVRLTAEMGCTIDQLRTRLLLGGTNFNAWATSPQTAHVKHALEGKGKGISRIKVLFQLRTMGFLGMKFASQLLTQFPHLVHSSWWHTAMGRAFGAAVACDDPLKAIGAVAEVVKDPGFQELCNEIEIRIGEGKKGAAVTAGLKDLV